MAFSLSKFLKMLVPGAIGAAGGFATGGPIGAAAGGAAGLLSGAQAVKRKKQKQFEQVPRYTPEQQEIFKQLAKQGMSDSDIKGLEQLYQRQFQEETIPGIAERFSQMGTGGQRSSAFINALTGAGEGLSAQLAALRSRSGLSKLQLGLQPQFDTAYFQGQPGIEDQTMGPLIQLLGMGLMGGGGFGGTEYGGFGKGAQGKKGTAPGAPLYFGGQPQGYNVGQRSPAYMKTLLGMGF